RHSIRNSPLQMPRRDLPVTFPGRPLARPQPGNAKPGMPLKKLQKMLAHHAGGAKDADLDFWLHEFIEKLTDCADRSCNLSICQSVNGFTIFGYSPTASSTSRFEIRSSAVWATWIDPGPSRNGWPQRVSSGMSVVNFTTVVSMPGIEPRWTGGTSRTTRVDTR